MPDPYEELEELAGRVRVRTRPLNLHFPGLPGGSFDRVCRFKLGNRRVEVATNGEWLLGEVEGATSLCFAVGEPDQVHFARHAVARVAGTTVFSLDPEPPDDLKAWLVQPETEELLRALSLTVGERMLISKNAVTAAFRPGGLDADFLRLDALVHFAAQLPPPDDVDDLVDGLRFDAEQLPSPMRSLANLVRRWAAGDDEARAEQITAASDDELSQLVRNVHPHLGDIDRLFDQQLEPVADETVLIGRLAEAALEAEQELGRRRA